MSAFSVKRSGMRWALVAGVLVAGVIVPGVPAFAGSQELAPSGGGGSSWTGSLAAAESRAESCVSGNFRGTATVNFSESANGSVVLNVESYMIERLNGQEGGDKANLVVRHRVLPAGVPRDIITSPDALIQDGQVHPVTLSGTAPYASDAEFRLYFIFDKSWDDPSCSVVIDAGL